MKYIAFPKSILLSDDLYASTKRYAAAQLSFRRDEKNRFRKPLRYLAERANLCVSTARQAISQLEEIGFLTQSAPTDTMQRRIPYSTMLRSTRSMSISRVGMC